MVDELKKHVSELREIKRKIYENQWAVLWHDTIRGVDWLEDLGSVSPGRMAVGYNYMYVMTRVLNECRPERVLDIGLGISSTLFAQYFRHCSTNESEHLVIEHESSWRDFYCRSHKLSECSRIEMLPVKMVEEFGDKHYVYKGFKKKIGERKFHVISVDGPFGHMTDEKGAVSYPKYARCDIVRMIPEILEEDFAIVFDDAERKGEQNTVKLICKKLESNGIAYRLGYYRGEKDCYVIASESNKYLCSM